MEENSKRKISSTGEAGEGQPEEKGAGGEGTTAASAGRTRGTSGRSGRRTAGAAEEKDQSAETLGVPEVEKPKKTAEKPGDVPIMLPTMTDEEKKKLKERERAKRYREKKKAEKQAQAQPVEMFNNEQLVALVVTLSGLIAARPGCQHWQLTQPEAQQLVTPICNIVKANTNIQDLGKYADHIALVIACVTILLPRAIISIQQLAQQRGKKKEVVRNGYETGKTAESNAEHSRRPMQEQHDDKNGDTNILADLATAGY